MGATCGTPRALMNRNGVGKNMESQALFWTSPQVAAWIEMIGLGVYVPRFLENGVDGAVLLELRRDQFERCLGVTDPMHELSLRMGLLDLKTKIIDYTKWEWSCDGVAQWLALRGLDQLISRFSSAAVHGSVLFGLSKQEFASRLHVGELGESELVLNSLWYAVERAKKVGFYQEPGNYLDWGPTEIQEWLNDMHLGHLNDTFREHAVNGTLLPRLDQGTLRRVMKLTEIQTIVVSKAIRKLVNKNRPSGSGSRKSLVNNKFITFRSKSSSSSSGSNDSTADNLSLVRKFAPSGTKNHHHHHQRSASMDYVSYDQENISLNGSGRSETSWDKDDSGSKKHSKKKNSNHRRAASMDCVPYNLHDVSGDADMSEFALADRTNNYNDNHF